MTNHCGTCTACCRVFNVAELKKPAGTWCQHCNIGKGCKIYDERPLTCKTYQCLWLQSQYRPEPERFAPELRPDRCKVVFSPTTNDNVMSAVTMNVGSDAWKKPAVLDVIKRLVGFGIAVTVGPPAARKITMISPAGIKEVNMSEPDENGIQWNLDQC